MTSDVISEGPDGERAAALVPQDAAQQYDPDQAWFWSPEWQAAEREAEADLAAGRVERFDSAEAFLASLDGE
jgi:hypothetical protein